MYTKKKKIKHNKTKKKNNNTLSILVNFKANDYGYSDLLKQNIMEFIIDNVSHGRNLIQTQDNKPFYITHNSTLNLQAVSVKKWNMYPTWENIKCKSYNDFIKMSKCEIGKTTKLFVKLKSNELVGGFATYILALHLGVINKKEHKEFVKSMIKTFKDNPIRIHNEDVHWFHLKQAFL